MSNIILDDEFKKLLPPLQEDQKEELEKDILKNGCISPIFIWKNILIDGYHRHEICTKHNIPFKLVNMDFKDKTEALEWIWLHQKNRRNLTKYELAQIALKFKPLIEAKAKENKVSAIKQAETYNSKKQDSLLMKSSKTNNKENSIEECLKKSEEILKPVDSDGNHPIDGQIGISAISEEKIQRLEPINTRKEIAKIAGVSEDTIHKVELIEEKAPEEIKQQVKKGDITINSAYVLTKSAIETEKKNADYEKKYQEQLEKGKQEQDAQRKLEEIEKSLPGNTVVLDKFRKPEETHIFGITDFNNLTDEQFDKCLKHCKRYQEAIHKVEMLSDSLDSLRAWECILENQEEIDLELSTINNSIQVLNNVRNYFKGVKKG